MSWAQAGEQLRSLSQALNADPGFPREVKNFEERIIPLQAGATQDVRSELLVTWAAVLMVLLIGCVNIAGLLLARAGGRSREIATRLALGGSRTAIVRQLLIESVLLALGGGIVGIGAGAFALDWLKQLGAEKNQLWYPIELDARVLAVMMGDRAAHQPALRPGARRCTPAAWIFAACSTKPAAASQAGAAVGLAARWWPPRWRSAWCC